MGSTPQLILKSLTCTTLCWINPGCYIELVCEKNGASKFKGEKN